MLKQKQQPASLPSRDDYNQWRHSLAGEWFFSWLQAYCQDVVQGMVVGETVDTDSVEATALSTLKALTKAQMLYEIGTEASYETIKEMTGEKTDE